MATSETIKKIFITLRSRYPNRFKTAEEVNRNMAIWHREYKDTPDRVLIQAVDMICRSSQWFPNDYEVHDKIVRVGWIDQQKIATYEGRLKTYREYEAATEEQINAWVDMHRFIYDYRGWTTKDFKEYRQNAKDQLNLAIRDLPPEYREEHQISEV